MKNTYFWPDVYLLNIVGSISFKMTLTDLRFGNGFFNFIHHYEKTDVFTAFSLL